VFCHPRDLTTDPRTWPTKSTIILFVVLLFSLEKESFENEFPFIKFSRLEMIKLVYLEFRLGVQFSCSCVKREGPQLQFDNEPEANVRPLQCF
jgi:hypothetical protein